MPKGHLVDKIVYNTLILGAGIAGLTIAAALARRGVSAHIVERARDESKRGPSHPSARGLRLAYAHLPALLPMVERVIPSWRALEARHDHQLFFEHGAAQIIPPEHPLSRGMIALDGKHGLSVEPCEAKTIDAFHLDLPDGTHLFREHRAGILNASAIHALLLDELAREALQRSATVTQIIPTDSGVEVLLAGGMRLTASRLILCPGGALGDVLAMIPSTTTRWMPPLKRKWQVEVWLAREPDPNLPPMDSAPLLDIVSDDKNLFGLGIPGHPHAFKMTRRLDHSPASVQVERDAILAEARRWLPGNWRVQRTIASANMITPDRLFLLGAHPRHPRISIFGGLSGHGYKFAPLLAEMLAEHLLDNAALPEIFAPARFGS